MKSVNSYVTLIHLLQVQLGHFIHFESAHASPYQYGAVGNDAKCCFIFLASLYDDMTPGFPTFASNRSFALRLYTLDDTALRSDDRKYLS
mmetsp:Transcript_9941/g.21500  ORF Transcript_9941/g.21500 Transcript_9941/m.21500 type:complete len:90 (-) Transcript_9941:3487-3756(-)